MLSFRLKIGTSKNVADTTFECLKPYLSRLPANTSEKTFYKRVAFEKNVKQKQERTLLDPCKISECFASQYNTKAVVIHFS